MDPSLLLLGGNATLPPLLPPAVFFGTNGSCNVPGIDYIAGFDAWTGPKVRTGNDVRTRTHTRTHTLARIPFCATKADMALERVSW